MATAALVQEKVWFDKPSYDRALRQHFERLAKVVSHKIKASCPPSSNNITDKLQEPGNGNNLKSKTKKCKDNRSVECGANDTKHSKAQQKHGKCTKKEDNYNVPKIETLQQIEKSDAKNVKEVEINIVNETAEKNKGKQAKEEKNKADKRHRNKEKGKFDMEEQKEQSPSKGTQQSTCPILSAGGSLASEVAKARQHIKQSLQCMDDIAILAGVSNQPDVVSRVAALEKENQDLRNIVQELRNVIDKLDDRVKSLEGQSPVSTKIAVCPAKPAPVSVNAPAKDSKDDDDDVDLFGSDSEGEDEEAAKIREQRLAAYAAKKSKKPVLIAKSNIILDVKPWDDETDMKAMESEVRKIEMDGLLWGAAKLVPLAYGICKLQISCVVEDDKVSVDALTEKIQDIEDFVQSVDIAAFNKV